MLNFVGIATAALAGMIAFAYGGWPAVGAVMLGETSVALNIIAWSRTRRS